MPGWMPAGRLRVKRGAIVGCVAGKDLHVLIRDPLPDQLAVTPVRLSTGSRWRIVCVTRALANPL